MEHRGGSSHSHRATELLQAWGAGDAAAFELLIPLVHAELRRLARRYMGHERPGHTLQPTALVNEAYLRLVDLQKMRWQDRAHFLSMAARLMRRILVDNARSKGYRKRGGGARQVTLDEALVISRPAQRRLHRPGRRADAVRRDLAAEGRGRRAAILWRTQRRGDRRSPARVARDREARLAIGEVVARSPAEHCRAEARRKGFRVES